MTYKVGDTVTVRGTITSLHEVFTHSGMVTCSFNAPLTATGNLTFAVHREDIVSHEPTPIKVGEEIADAILATVEK